MATIKFYFDSSLLFFSSLFFFTTHFDFFGNSTNIFFSFADSRNNIFITLRFLCSIDRRRTFNFWQIKSFQFFQLFFYFFSLFSMNEIFLWYLLSSSYHHAFVSIVFHRFPIAHHTQHTIILSSAKDRCLLMNHIHDTR